LGRAVRKGGGSKKKKGGTENGDGKVEKKKSKPWGHLGTQSTQTENERGVKKKLILFGKLKRGRDEKNKKKRLNKISRCSTLKKPRRNQKRKSKEGRTKRKALNDRPTEYRGAMGTNFPLARKEKRSGGKKKETTDYGTTTRMEEITGKLQNSHRNRHGEGAKTDCWWGGGNKKVRWGQTLWPRKDGNKKSGGRTAGVKKKEKHNREKCPPLYRPCPKEGVKKKEAAEIETLWVCPSGKKNERGESTNWIMDGSMLGRWGGKDRRAKMPVGEKEERIGETLSKRGAVNRAHK